MNVSRPLILRNSDFCLIWIGQVLSQAGTRMYQIALIWWILSQTAESTGGKAVGLFLVMGALPAILFVRQIGRLVDKTRTKRVLVGCDLVAFATVAAIGLAVAQGAATLVWVFVVGFIVALLQATFDPALNKSIPELVEPEDIESGVAFQTSTQSMANFGGAVLGAALIDSIGIANVVYLNAFSYFLSAICAGIAHFRYAAPPAHSGADEVTEAGWKVLEAYPFLKRVLIGFGLINFFATPTFVILPLYTKQTLQMSATVLGLLEAALWIGLLLGAFSSRFFGFVKSKIKLGASCLFTMGLCLFLPGIFINHYLYMVLLFIAGFVLGVNNVKFVAYFQETVAPEIKGRFFALMQALLSFTFPIAFLLFGALSDFLTPPIVCRIQGLGVMGLALYFLTLLGMEKEANKQTLEAVPES